MRQAYIEAHDLRIWDVGEVATQEDLGTGLAWIESPDWIVARRWFIDLSRLRKVDVDYHNVFGFTQRNQPVLKGVSGVRVAMLVKSDVAFGMARMYQALMADAGLDYQIFQERADCAAFLDVPEDTLEFPPEPE